MTRLVSIWLLDTGQPRELVDRLAEVLDEPERARAAAIAEAQVHAEFVVSHAATRLILAELLGVPPQVLRWRHGPSGKPYLAEPGTDLQISLSHSDGLAALAVSAGSPVGVDVQAWRDAAGLVRMAKRYYPPDEARFVAQALGPAEAGRRFGMLWTRKEACAKVGGGRLIPALAWPSRQPVDPDWVGGPFRSGDPATGEPVLIRDLAVPDGFCGAVAMAGSADFQVVSRWWAPEASWLAFPFQPTAQPPAQIGVPMAVPGC